jgi:hypothetical protein
VPLPPPPPPSLSLASPSSLSSFIFYHLAANFEPAERDFYRDFLFWQAAGVMSGVPSAAQWIIVSTTTTS